MYKAPFSYFGGKSKIADEVWKRLGPDSPNYIEPFAGSAAMLLSRPGWTPNSNYTETINDADGFVSNFWRALQCAPDDVAHYADWPVNENDLHARHAWLVGQRDSLQSRLEGDPNYFDAKIAGWWCWGACCWIGSGWCAGKGPWQQIDGELVNVSSNAVGVKRQRVHLGHKGVGVNRQRVHLGDKGVGEAGTGDAGLYEWMHALAERLRRVRVASGDWQRVCGSNTTTIAQWSSVAVFLDPPYSFEAGRDNNLYAMESGTVAHDVREWAIAHGDDSRFRIALCGYDIEHEHLMPEGWQAMPWEAHGGYANPGNVGKDNALREVVWFSPHCRSVIEANKQMSFLEA